MKKTTKPSCDWAEIQEAVNTLDKKALTQLGKGAKPLVQEGVTINEMQEQIMALAPGNHPHLGSLLLCLADRL